LTCSRGFGQSEPIDELRERMTKLLKGNDGTAGLVRHATARPGGHPMTTKRAQITVRAFRGQIHR